MRWVISNAFSHVLGEVVLDNVAHTGGGEEILLTEPEDLALHMVVVGVQHLADQLGVGALGDGAVVLARIEAVHIKAGGLRFPQAQLGNAVGIIARHIQVAGHGDDGGVALVFHMVVLAVPGLVDIAVEVDVDGLVGVALEPDAAAGQPVVGALLLPAVQNTLFEDAELIEDGVPHAGDVVSGHAVEVARRQTAQAAVAKPRVRLWWSFRTSSATSFSSKLNRFMRRLRPIRNSMHR